MEGLSLLLKQKLSEQLISGIKVSKSIKLLHLFFVDDVLLLSKAELTEWMVILEVLQQFCSVSGLSINFSKSSILHWGLSDNELIILKNSIPYTFVSLNGGFRYLGFQLKLGTSSLIDWKGLVTHFESRINCWYNKWLSLGGRYILIKSVLEISLFTGCHWKKFQARSLIFYGDSSQIFSGIVNLVNSIFTCATGPNCQNLGNLGAGGS
jgi:hypothetical protein